MTFVIKDFPNFELHIELDIPTYSVGQLLNELAKPDANIKTLSYSFYDEYWNKLNLDEEKIIFSGRGILKITSWDESMFYEIDKDFLTLSEVMNYFLDAEKEIRTTVIWVGGIDVNHTGANVEISENELKITSWDS
jgi:hypothetical protein